MAQRAGLAFESEIRSDCAPLTAPVQALLAAGRSRHRALSDIIGRSVQSR